MCGRVAGNHLVVWQHILQKGILGGQELAAVGEDEADQYRFELAFSCPGTFFVFKARYVRVFLP